MMHRSAPPINIPIDQIRTFHSVARYYLHKNLKDIHERLLRDAPVLLSNAFATEGGNRP
jgi:hypothetical protein